MIDYEILCKTIEDWKGGRQPTALRSHMSQRQPPDHPAQEDRTMIYEMPQILDEE
jgi:hypothetical protein